MEYRNALAKWMFSTATNTSILRSKKETIRGNCRAEMQMTPTAPERTLIIGSIQNGSLIQLLFLITTGRILYPEPHRYIMRSFLHREGMALLSILFQEIIIISRELSLVRITSVFRLEQM